MELQQFRIRAAWIFDRKDQRGSVREICAGKYLQPAGDERLGLRFEHCHHFAPSFRLFAWHGRTGERGLYRHEYSTIRGKAVFHYRRSAALGAGTVWRQVAVARVVAENDHAV